MRSSISLPSRSSWPLLRAVAFDVAVDVDLDHLVGREEAVADALLQRVGVDRLAEVVDVGDVLRFPSAWRSGRSGWRTRSSRGSRARRSPRAALPRWHSSMTIRSKKSGENSRVELLPLLRPGDRLVEAEIDLVGGVDPALLVERQRQIDPWCRPAARWSWRWCESLAIAAPNGRKSLTIVWSISTLRSARNRMRFLRPAFHRRQMIWKAV